MNLWVCRRHHIIKYDYSTRKVLHNYKTNYCVNYLINFSINVMKHLVWLVNFLQRDKRVGDLSGANNFPQKYRVRLCKTVYMSFYKKFYSYILPNIVPFIILQIHHRISLLTNKHFIILSNDWCHKSILTFLSLHFWQSTYMKFNWKGTYCFNLNSLRVEWTSNFLNVCVAYQLYMCLSTNHHIFSFYMKHEFSRSDISLRR